MASATVEVTIIGAGNSRIGLWLLAIIARMFHIKLEVRQEE